MLCIRAILLVISLYAHIFLFIDHFHDLTLRHEGCVYSPLMETIAITFWNGLVSPLFDAAATVLVVASGKEREQIPLGNGPLLAKVNVLEKHSVKVLICGAISAGALGMLQERDIRVVSWIRGPIEDVLKAHESDTLEAGPFLMPGCGRGGRCRNRRNRGSVRGGGQCRRSFTSDNREQ